MTTNTGWSTPYDEESFKWAVIQGVNPGEESLDPPMLRWQMSD